MANAMQRAATRRKLSYAAAIVALFTVSIFWRGKLPVPFSNQVPLAARLSSGSVLGRAQSLEMRELDQGDPEVFATALRLTLFGTRGAAVTALWWGAIEKQKRNEFHEFELLVQAVTKLQPNFITPWLYQSWNLAYNVSVEHDKLGDMYFYIARGIELLAEGDKVNTRLYKDPETGRDVKVGSPDLRYNIGFYYQNKFSVSDKTNTLRSLMQVSCIPPGDRKRSAFEPSGTGIDPAAFERFCKTNPQLVRRLRNKLACNEPEEVVTFLYDNEKIPTIYKNDTELAAPDAQFPVLPERFASGPDEYAPVTPKDDTFDAFHAARAWYGYSLTSVPPAKTDSSGEPLPWHVPMPGEYDSFRYRVPRAPAMIVFRQAGPRAQTYLAERLSKEGWFDRTTVWNPDEDMVRRGWPAALATPRTSQEEWRRAAAMWTQHGTVNGLILSDARLAQIEYMAGARAGSPPVGDASGEVSAQDRADAQMALRDLGQNLQITQFAYFLASAKAEGETITVQAREALYKAEEARERGQNARAVELYREGLAKWRRALIEYPTFHRPGGVNGGQLTTEEATFEYELALQNLLKSTPEVANRARELATLPGSTATAGALLGAAAGASPEAEKDFIQAIAETEVGLQVAVESILSEDPLLKPQASDPRDAARREVDSRLQKRPEAERTDKVRREIARQVVREQYPWMTTFKVNPKRPGQIEPDLADYFVRPDVSDTVRQRMNLVRRAPETGGAAAPEEASGQ